MLTRTSGSSTVSPVPFASMIGRSCGRDAIGGAGSVAFRKVTFQVWTPAAKFFVTLTVVMFESASSAAFSVAAFAL